MAEEDPTTTTTVPEVVLTVLSKAAWGGRDAGELTAHIPVRLTVHHTASGASDPSSAPERIRGYQRYHMNQGWADVAYHLLIDQAGRVYQGRSPDAAGDTFTEYDPSGHFLPCLDGDFDKESPSQASLDALVLVLAWGVQEYGIDPGTLAGHRDYAGTKCPGANLYALLGSIREELETLLAAGTVVRLEFSDESV